MRYLLAIIGGVGAGYLFAFVRQLKSLDICTTNLWIAESMLDRQQARADEAERITELSFQVLGDNNLIEEYVDKLKNQ